MWHMFIFLYKPGVFCIWFQPEYQGVIVRCLNIVLEASRATENVVILRQLGYVQAAKPICEGGSMFTAEFVIAGTMTISLVMNDNEVNIVKLDDRELELGWLLRGECFINQVFMGWNLVIRLGMSVVGWAGGWAWGQCQTLLLLFFIYFSFF